MDKVRLIFAPAKTGQGRMKGSAGFTWRRRSGDVDDDLSRRFPLEGGARKKSLKKLRERFGGNGKDALSLHSLSLLESEGDEDDEKSSLTILT